MHSAFYSHTCFFLSPALITRSLAVHGWRTHAAPECAACVTFWAARLRVSVAALAAAGLRCIVLWLVASL